MNLRRVATSGSTTRPLICVERYQGVFLSWSEGITLPAPAPFKFRVNCSYPICEIASEVL